MSLIEKLAYYTNLKRKKDEKIKATFEKIAKYKAEQAKLLGMTIEEYNRYMDEELARNLLREAQSTQKPTQEDVISHWDYVANNYKPMNKWRKKK